MEDARELIKSGRQEISNVASSLRVEGTTSPTQVEESREPSKEDKIAQGTACIVCSSEHFSEVSGSLNEAMRFARSEGVDNKEVTRRLRHAREELNTMERFDLSPQQIMNLPELEEPLGRWAVEQSRQLRHSLNAIKDTQDLEKVAAQASNVADEFEEKTMEIKKHYEGEIHPDVDLKKWLEGRKKRGE